MNDDTFPGVKTRSTEGGKIGEKAMEAIRGGWYLGEEGFRNKLLGLMDLEGAKVTKRGSVAGGCDNRQSIPFLRRSSRARFD